MLAYITHNFASSTDKGKWDSSSDKRGSQFKYMCLLSLLSYFSKKKEQNHDFLWLTSSVNLEEITIDLSS